MSVAMCRSAIGRRRAIAGFIAALACLNTMGVCAADACAGEVCAEQGWARATPGGAQNAAVYFSIVNNGGVEDTLSGASTTAAKQAMVHQSALSGNVMRMAMVGSVAVPPHGRVTLTPRGYHLMLTGLKAPLKEGMTIPVTLRFLGAGNIILNVRVLNIAAAGPGSPAGATGPPAAHAHH